MQLVPGTEVAVAPKRRFENLSTQEDRPWHSSDEKFQRALLRVQDSSSRLTQNMEVNSVTLRISLTAIAYVHPETAQCFGFDCPHSVVILPSSFRGSKSNLVKNSLKVKGEKGAKEVSPGSSTTKKGEQYAVVSLLMSDTVARGHMMMAQPLCMYLGVGPHSCT